MAGGPSVAGGATGEAPRSEIRALSSALVVAVLEASLCSFVLSISSTAATTANTDSHEPMRLAGDGSGSGFREEDLLLKKGGR